MSLKLHFSSWLRCPLLIAALFCQASPLRALEIGVPNGSLEPLKKAAVGAPSIPSKWVLAGGEKDGVTKWEAKDEQGNALAYTAIAAGVELISRQFDLPALTEKEQKVEGDWSGLLSLDHLGVLKGNGRASWKLGLYDVTTGKIITSLKGATQMQAKSGEAQVFRAWSEISAQKMKALEGKKLKLKVSVISGGPLVISGISLSRLHSAPSNKLFGRSNGGSGPDLLGAGSLGFDAMTEHRQRVLTIMSVRKGTPADKAGLKAGDKIIGVNRKPLPVNDLNPGWQWFYHSHESVLGRAVAHAWSSHPTSGQGVVELVVLRKGKPVRLKCQLTQSMDFDRITESKNKDVLHAQLIEYLCKNQQKDGGWRGPIRTTFAALALLATQDPAHTPRVKKAVDWFLNKYPEPENFGNLGFWHSSYAGILYCEYYLATGDARVLPRASAILDWVLSGTHTSKWGMACLGHGTGGLPYGQKALVAPATHALVFDALAEKCGIKSGLWNTLLPYMEHSWSDPAKGGHGSMGYNASFKDKGQFWSRSGLFSMAAHLRGERKDMEGAMIGFMSQRYPWIRNSHAYGEPGGALGLLALNLCNPKAYEDVLNAYGWWFALAWEPNYGLRFTTPHMGAPYMGTDDLICATYALVLGAPKKSLAITGGQQTDWLDVSKIETPLSEVVTRRGKTGQISLSCKIPGPQIRYTIDGSPPSNESPLYEKPIDFPQGGTLKARAYNSGIKSGEVTSVTYGPAKSGWKVLAASGHQDPVEAVRRASYAINHARSHSWLTDVGQGAVGYPHFVVIDLGQEMKLQAVQIEFQRDASACKRCVVKVSSSLTEAPRLASEVVWPAFQAIQRVQLNQASKARYLRLEFSEPVKEGSIALTIREIDVE